MAFTKWAAPALFALALAGPLTSGAAQAQNNPSRTAAITLPAAGASVSSPLTVSYSLTSLGGATGTPPISGKHHHGGQAFLVIDSPAPAAGDTITADAKDIAFPAGQTQLSVSLPSGQHQLQIVFANHKNEVSSHMQPSAPVAITVK